MNREQLKKIDHLLSFGDIIAKEENEYNLTDKAVIKLINEIEKLSHPLEAEVSKKFTDVVIFANTTGYAIYLNGYRVCGDKPDNSSRLVYNNEKILIKDITKAFGK